METSETHIRLLPTELANQIAAGEVVERPSSVLKELVENSLDANATSISAIIEDGGQVRIQVSDNGRGISKSELSLAVTRHATSKVQEISDLSSIKSFGFRGEALPSIASVSRFRISSIQENSDEAYSLKINFGDELPIEPTSLHRGTQVEVCDLFNNIPARLKFLKTPSTEFKRSQEIFTRIGLAHLGIGFELYAGTREVLSFLAKDTLFDRICKIWPPSITNTLLEVNEKIYDITIEGLISDPRSLYSKADKVLLYVNKRPVTDKLLMRAVRQAYKNSLTTKDYPQVVINIDIDPEEIDVNVHPAKSEVRFRDEQKVFKAVFAALDKNLSKKLLLNQEYFKPINSDNFADLASNSYNNNYEAKASFMQTSQAADFRARLDHERDMQKKMSENSGFVNNNSGFWGYVDEMALNLDKQGHYDRFVRHSEETDSNTVHSPKSIVERPQNEENAFFDKEYDALANTSQGIVSNHKNSNSSPEFLYQVSSSYLLFALASSEVFVLDQHAVHERILYEKLSQNKTLTVQNLLLPLSLSLHASEAAAFLEIEKELVRYGFDCRIAKSQEVLDCFAVPYMFEAKGAEEFLRKALKNESLSVEKLFMDYACDLAIKANSKMSPQEAKSLYNEWISCQEPDFCPHGRPCYQIVNREFLDKIFKR